MKRRKIFIILLILVVLFTGTKLYMIGNENTTNSTEIATVAVEEEVVTITEEEEKEEKEIITEEEEEEEIIMYTTTGVNMRDEPSLNGEIIETLYINTEVTTVGEIDGWTKIKYDENTIYYIKSDYLSEEKTEISVTSRSSSTTRSTSSSNLTYLGTYKLTYYCSCTKCCGKSDGITASGVKAQEGVTVASNSIALGTKISINGQIYTVQDRGGMASNVIDIYVSSHEKALKLGVKTNVPVYKVN